MSKFLYGLLNSPISGIIFFNNKEIIMKKLKYIFILSIGLLIALSPFSFADNDINYANTIKLFKESKALQKFFNTSYGYAVFPTIGKAGWIVGGSYGKGKVYRGGVVTGRVSVIEGSIGLQAGGKAFSEIIFFEDKRAYDEFTSDTFEFDATVQATAITAGAGVQAGTHGSSAGASSGPRTGVQAETDYYKGMAIFVHSKGGLMYEVSVGGQKFKFKPIVRRK
jgi:lipid-binding SYLF domain-containing protein